MWKEAAVAYFDVLPQNIHERSEQNPGKTQLKQPDRDLNIGPPKYEKVSLVYK
jgi:hypothetical protein